MEPATRNNEEPQQNETHGSHISFMLPKIEKHRSLQGLIADCLNSQSDGSLETAALLARKVENPGSGGAVSSPALAIQDERPQIRAESTSCDTRSSEQETTGLYKDAKSALAGLWRRMFGRRQAKLEQPKTVYSHKRCQILREAIAIHLLPVAINLALLGLYIRRVSWTPPWPTTNVLNALQFAAKIHETLMIASLFSVLLHHVRYRLLSPGSRGLPLGLITSPFRLLDITYLWGRDFLSTLKSPETFSISEVTTIVMHIFLFVLAAVLGPASAISMLPRMGEWQLAKTIANAPFYNKNNGNCDLVYQFYMGAELADIYPKTITANFSPEACDYNNLSLPQTNLCPRRGLTDILQSIYFPKTTDVGSNLLPSQQLVYRAFEEILVQEHHEDLTNRVIILNTHPFLSELDPFELGFGAIVDVTTPTDAVWLLTFIAINHYDDCWVPASLSPDSFNLGGDWPAQFTLYAAQTSSGDSSLPWKQPYVSSFCSNPGVVDSASDSMIFEFHQDNSMPPYTVKLGVRVLQTMLGDIGMGFINSSDLDITPSYTPSTALVFTSQSNTTLCLVNAYWIDFTLSSPQFPNEGGDPMMDNLVWDWQAREDGPTAWYNYKFRDENDWFNHTKAIEIIQLDLDWLEILDHGTGSDNTGKHGFFDNVRRACLGSTILGGDDSGNAGNYPNLVCIAAGLGAGIAEGLSKVPYHVGIHALGVMEDLPPNALMFSTWSSSLLLTTGENVWLIGNWTNSTLTPSRIKTNSARLDFTLTQRVYGYSFNSITIILAFVALSLYVTTVLIHISIMTFGTSWSSRAWKTLGEFYVLALQSPTPTSILNNTGGGVKASATWRTRASVKELQGGNRVGIVFEESGQSDVEDGSMSKVRPDWKYS